MDDLLSWLKNQTITTLLLVANFALMAYGLAYGVPAAISQVQAGYDRHRQDFREALSEIAAQMKEEQAAARTDSMRVLSEQRADFLAQLNRERELWLDRVDRERVKAAAASAVIPN